jgi:hypothetical protein
MLTPSVVTSTTRHAEPSRRTAYVIAIGGWRRAARERASVATERPPSISPSLR